MVSRSLVKSLCGPRRLWWRLCRAAPRLPGLPCWAPAMPWTQSAMRSGASSADAMQQLALKAQGI